MRTGAALLLVLIVAVLGGCGQSPTSAPSPRPTSTPTAASYRDLPALVAAIRAGGQAKLSDVSIGTFPKELVPPEAHAQRGVLFVVAPGDEAPWYTVAAVFPDSTWKRYGVAYGQHMAAVGYHAPAIYQLRGPNWFLWGIHKRTLEAVQSAIGGQLGHTLLATPSPKATS